MSEVPVRGKSGIDVYLTRINENELKKKQNTKNGNRFSIENFVD